MRIAVACAEKWDGEWKESVFCQAPNGAMVSEALLDDGDECALHNPYEGQKVCVKVAVNGENSLTDIMPGGHRLLMYRDGRSFVTRSFPPMAVTVTCFTYPRGEQRSLWWYNTPQGGSRAVATLYHGESGMIHSPERDRRVIISLQGDGTPKYGGILAPEAFLSVKRSGDMLECTGFLVENQGGEESK